MRPVALIPTPLRTRALVLAVLAAGCSAADSGYKGIVPGKFALGKLCHELNRGGQPVTLTLKFGDPAIAEITGVTGVCAPTPGTPCTMIPTGLVPIKLYEGDKLLTSRNVTLIPPKEGEALTEYVFQPIITSTLQVAVTGGRIAPGTCAGLDFPPPDGGVLDGGGDGAALEAGAAEGGVEAGPLNPDAAGVDAGAADVPVLADAAADAGAPDAEIDGAAPADVAADLGAD